MRTLVVLLILAALLGVIYWAWSGFEHGAETPGSMSPAAESSAPAESALELVEEKPSPTTTETTRVPHSAASRESLVEPEPEGDAVRVLFVDRKSDEPLTGVQAWYADPKRVGRYRRELPDGVTYEPKQAIQAVGWPLATDGQGRATLPMPDSRWMVFGMTAEHEGRAVLRKRDFEDGEAIVRLRAQNGVWIRVFDNLGQPVGSVPIAAHPPGEPSHAQVELGVTSDEDGRLFVPRVEGVSASYFEAVGSPFELTVLVPLAERPVVLVDPSDLPEHSIDLNLPPTAPLHLTVLGVDGQPFSSPVSIKLYRADRQDRPSTLPRYLTLDDRGGLTIPHVGLGLELDLAVTPQGDYAPVTYMGPGPTNPGVPLEVIVQIEGLRPTLVMTIHGEQGKPLANEGIEAVAHTQTEGSGPRTNYIRGKRTDAEGQLRLEVDDDSLETLSFRLELDVPTADFGTQNLFIQVPLPLSFGENDLGTLSPSAEPLLVSGEVFDPQGNGAEADLGLMLAIESESGGPTNWGWLVGQNLSTGSTGKFAFRGTLESGTYAIRVSSNRFEEPPPVAFEIGERNVRIELGGVGRVRGRLDLPEGIPGGAFDLTLVEQGEGRERGQMQVAEANSAGSFRFDDLDGGVYELQVRLFGEPDPGTLSSANQGESARADLNDLVAHVPNLRVVIGDDCKDERLDLIPVRSSIRTFEVSATDSGGKPITKGYVLTRPDAATEWTSNGFAIRSGQAKIFTTHRILNLGIGAPGQRRKVVQGVHSDLEVTLQSALPVRLTLASGTTLPPAGSTLCIRLQPRSVTHAAETFPDYATVLTDSGGRDWINTSTSVDHQGWSSFPITADAHVDLFVPNPGTYELSWSLKSDKGLQPYALALMGEDQIVEVLDVVTPQSFAIRPPTEDYEGLLNANKPK